MDQPFALGGRHHLRRGGCHETSHQRADCDLRHCWPSRQRSKPRAKRLHHELLHGNSVSVIATATNAVTKIADPRLQRTRRRCSYARTAARSMSLTFSRQQRVGDRHGDQRGEPRSPIAASMDFGRGGDPGRPHCSMSRTSARTLCR